MISFEDFKKLDMRIGEIKAVEEVEDADKLLRLEVDIGEEEDRQIISGIKKYFDDTSSLVDRKVVVLANLEPKEIFGFLSEGMILAAHGDDNFSLLTSHESVGSGTKIM